jgi:hypothetical protein
MAAGAMVEDAGWLGELQGELRGVLAPVFAQARSRLTAFAYIGALLPERGDRKSCWQLAEEAGHATPRRMQALLAEYAWDWKEALAALQRFITAHLGDDEAIFVLDETAELKKGAATAGVARQHAGITGQIENCQTVVFAAYVTARAHALLDFRLYLPKSWCADQARLEKAHIPDDTAFITKPALGAKMITGAAGAGILFAWVAADEVYGRSSKLRQACEEAGRVLPAGKGPGRPGPAPGPDLALLLPPYRAVHVRPGPAGRRRGQASPARQRRARLRHRRPARNLGRYWETPRQRRRPATRRRARPGQGQRPRSPPPRPAGHRAHDRHRPHPRPRLVTMAPPPPGPRPMAPLPRPAHSRTGHLNPARRKET